jgi:hypothetical protein
MCCPGQDGILYLRSPYELYITKKLTTDNSVPAGIIIVDPSASLLRTPQTFFDPSNPTCISLIRERRVLINEKLARAVIVESEMSLDLDTGGTKFLIPANKEATAQQKGILRYGSVNIGTACKTVGFLVL